MGTNYEVKSYRTDGTCGFFIYQAEKPEKLIYANKAVINIYGCTDLEDFKAYTGFEFKGMVHPDDYQKVSDSILQQISTSNTQMDYTEYRIICFLQV